MAIDTDFAELGDGLPGIQILAGFGYGPLDPNPQWTNLTDRFRRLEITRRRDDEFGRHQPGQLNALLDNSDDALNSKNATSPYAGQIKPNVRIEVRARWNTVIYPVCVMFADNWHPRYPGGGMDNVIELQATGFFKQLAKADLSTAGTCRLIIGGTPLLKNLIDADDTAVTVSHYPDVWPDAGDFVIRVQDEYMVVTAGHNTTSLTVTRGYHSTATAHDGTTETNIFCLRSLDIDDTALPLDEWPDTWPDQGQVELKLDDERLLVTAGAGTTTPTVTRGYHGTVAAPHSTQTTLIRPNFAAGTTGERLEAVMVFHQIDAADYDLDTGRASIPEAEDLTGTNTLDHFQAVAVDTEDGVLFEARDGKVTFHDRHHRLLNSLTAQATFSDDGVEAGYDGLEPDFSDTYLYNEAVITYNGSDVEVVRDQPSIDEYGKASHSRTTLLLTANEAHGLADWIVYRHKEPRQRVPAMTTQGFADPDVLWPALLGLEVGDRITLERTPPGGTAWSEDYYHEGAKHTIEPGKWRTDMALTPVPDFFWILGDSTYSVLGDTTRLGY